MLDRMFPTTANSTGRRQTAGYGSLATVIVNRMDNMRASLVGSKQRELRRSDSTIAAKWGSATLGSKLKVSLKRKIFPNGW